ncbi:MAG: GNAT family N-acetyltransferase [Dehalococcoidia bacterium]
MTSDLATLAIRPLEQHDLPSLSDILGLSRHHIEGRWRERQAGAHTMLVAELDAAFAGSVSFEARDDVPGLMHLFALAVVPELQGRGIGARLIESVEDEARDQALLGVYLGVAIDNQDALRLYERLGYGRVGEPYTTRWVWYGANGESREIVERCYRMLKRFAMR